MSRTRYSDALTGLTLTISGAVTLLLSTFLRFTEPVNGFPDTIHNLLIQNNGWMLAVLSFPVAATGVRLYLHGGRNTALALLGLLGVCVFWLALASWGDEARTVQSPWLDTGLAPYPPSVVAMLGPAVPVAWLGIAVSFMGAALLSIPELKPHVVWAVAKVRGIEHSRWIITGLAVYAGLIGMTVLLVFVLS